MNKANRVKFDAIIIGIIIIAMFLAVAGTSFHKAKENSFSYHVVKIEGMTCIQWGNFFSYKGGLTCNWDEYTDRGLGE